jgi:hypothetical protein
MSFRCVMRKTEMTAGARKSSNRRAVRYKWKRGSTILRIWRKHMDMNATNLDKHLKSQTWRGGRALITHFWMALTSVLPQTKSRILYVWQESPEYPQAVAGNYKVNMLPWGRSSLQRVVKSLGMKCSKCFCTNGSHWPIALLLGKTHRRLFAFLKYMPST